MPNIRKNAKINLPPSLSYGQAAERLGVSRSHLWQVCQGNRKSQTLERRVRSLIAAHQERETAAA